MTVKIVAGVVAVVLLLVYVGAIAAKLKDVALTAVLLLGVAMAVVDLLHSLKRRED